MARKIPFARVLLAFLLATLFFLMGFLVSYLISYSRYQSVLGVQEQIRYNLLGLDLEKELARDSCDIFNPEEFTRELGQMGNTITLLEDRWGKTDERVLEQKKVYSLLEVQHFLLVQENNKQCGTKYPEILFFYSNLGSYENRANQIGFILGNLKLQNSNVMVYSFDYDLDYAIINILKEKYNITEPNTIVVNEGEPFQPTNIDQISLK